MKKYITEMCPHCETENSMFWDLEKNGFEAHCPACGHKMMLCSECQETVCEDGEPHNCDWDCNTGLCHRCKNLSTRVDIQEIAYQKYQLMWCIRHDISLVDILTKFSDDWEDEPADVSKFHDRLNDTGFNGSLWPCMAEFLQNEYLDSELMMGLLNPDQFRLYLLDIVDYLSNENKEV